MTASTAIFFLYVFTLLAIGWLAGRRTRDTVEDVHVADRAAHPMVAALSSAASTESGFVLLGMVGAGYTIGFNAFWIIPAGVIGYAILWLGMGRKLRSIAVASGATTVPELLGVGESKVLRQLTIISATIIAVVFLIAYTAAQFNAAGKAFDAQFEIGVSLSIALTASVIGLYLIFGNFRASLWTDIPQAALMFLTLALMPIIVVVSNGGLAALVSSLYATDPRLTDPFAGSLRLEAAWAAASWMVLALAYPGQPHAISRLIAVRKNASYRGAFVVSASWFTILYAGAVLLGCAARAWYGDVPSIVDDPERALPILASIILSGTLGSLVVAATFSAIASTADSTVTAAASILARVSGVRLGPKTGFRIVAVILVGLSALVAIRESGLVFDLVLYAWSGLGSTIGSAVVYIVFASRPRSSIVLLTLAIGATITVLVENSSESLLIGFSCATAVAFLVDNVLKKIESGKK